jgi:hypothetical protein
MQINSRNQSTASDPAHDIWKEQRHPLDRIFGLGPWL